MLITLARKPLGGATVVQCCLQFGCGSLNIDASRIGTGTGEVTTVTVPDHRSGNFGQDTQAYKDRPKLTVQRVDQGRWPANVLMVPTPDVLAHFPEVKGQVGMTKTVGGHRFMAGDLTTVQQFDHGKTDTGSAARYFKQINKDNDNTP